MVSDYPPGSAGYEFDRLDADLERLQNECGLLIAVWAWGKRRKLAKARERMRQETERALREHFLS